MPVVVDTSGPVGLLVLDDPDRHNTLSVEMFQSLRSALAKIEAEHDGPLLRIRGAGQSFCSGLDLDECAGHPGRLDEFLTNLSLAMRGLRRLRQVVVAEVQDNALAGGCALLTACDLVCVAPDARLGYPVHQVGLSPAVTLPTLISAIGPAHAASLLLSGSIIDGREALRIGLAHRLSASSETLSALVDELCSTFLDKGPVALATTKSWLNELTGLDQDGTFESTLEASIQSGRTEEAARLLEVFWSRTREAR